MLQIESLSATIETFRQQHGLPGLNVAITLGHKIVFEQAFGIALSVGSASSLETALRALFCTVDFSA